MQRYMLDTDKNILSDEEIRYYFQKMKNNEEVRKTIITHNIGLVIWEVNHKFGWTNIDKEDLVSIGLIGLINSVDTFDINKNIKFATYAVRCIDNQIMMGIRSEAKYLNIRSLNEIVENSDEKEELINQIKEENINIDEDLENQEIRRLILKINR